MSTYLEEIPLKSRLTEMSRHLNKFLTPEMSRNFPSPVSCTLGQEKDCQWLYCECVIEGQL